MGSRSLLFLVAVFLTFFTETRATCLRLCRKKSDGICHSFHTQCCAPGNCGPWSAGPGCYLSDCKTPVKPKCVATCTGSGNCYSKCSKCCTPDGNCIPRVCPAVCYPKGCALKPTPPPNMHQCSWKCIYRRQRRCYSFCRHCCIDGKCVQTELCHNLCRAGSCGAVPPKQQPVCSMECRVRPEKIFPPRYHLCKCCCLDGKCTRAPFTKCDNSKIFLNSKCK